MQTQEYGTERGFFEDAKQLRMDIEAISWSPAVIVEPSFC